MRTLADVRDAARAYKLLLDKCPAGEVYNIGGDETMSVGGILDTFGISLACVPIEYSLTLPVCVLPT